MTDTTHGAPAVPPAPPAPGREGVPSRGAAPQEGDPRPGAAGRRGREPPRGAAPRGGGPRLGAARRRGWARLRGLLLWAGLALGLGFGAVILILRYILLPQVDSYRGDIAAAMSRAMGVRVAIEAIDTSWRGLRPKLGLRGLQVFDRDGRAALSFDRVDVVMGWRSAVLLRPVAHRLEISAPSLELWRDADGVVFVAGIAVNAAAADRDFADWLLEQGSIVVRDARIRWHDALRQAPPLELQAVNLRIDNFGSRHRFGFTAEPPAQLAGRIDLRGDFRGDGLERLDEWRGEAYAEVSRADLAAWGAWVDYPLELPQGSGTLKLWLGIERGALSAVTAQMDARDVQVRLARHLPLLDLDHVGGRLEVRRTPALLEVAGKGLELATRDGLVLAPTDFQFRHGVGKGDGQERGELSATALDLRALARLAAYLPLEQAARGRLEEFTPDGWVRDLRLAWNGSRSTAGEVGAAVAGVGTGAAGAGAGAAGPGNPAADTAVDPSADPPVDPLAPALRLAGYTVRARFERLGMRPSGLLPGFDGMSGSVDATERCGVVNLAATRAALDLPRVFAEPRLELQRLSGQAAWTVERGRAEITLKNLSFRNADAEGSAAGRYAGDSRGPGEIDLNARLLRADGAAVARYMPLVAGADVRTWLAQALRGGTATDARLRLRGKLDKFPFAHGRDGVFQVTARVTGGVLAYAQDWPQIDGIAGDLLFEGPRMRVRASHGRILGAAIGGVTAEIADLGSADPLLTVQGGAQGPTAEFLAFIAASPVAERIGHFTDDLRAQGNGQLRLHLALPLNHVADGQVKGDFAFSANRLALEGSPAITDAAGQLQFTDKSISLREARGHLLGAPLSVAVSTRADGAVAIRGEGGASMAALNRHFELPLFEHLSGTTTWRSTLTVRRHATELVVESGLQGVASSLPEPFNKSATETLPLRVERTPVAGAAGEETITASLGKALNARFQRRLSGGRYVIDRGAVAVDEPLPALPESGVALAGRLSRVDLDLWQRLAGGGANGTAGGGVSPHAALPPGLGRPGAGGLLASVSLRANEAVAAGRTLHDFSLQARRQGEAWRAQVGSKEVAGDLTWHGGGQGRLQARLKRLVLDEPAHGEAATEPLRELPGLDLEAESFTVRGRNFGRLDLMAQNRGGLWHVDKLSLTSPEGSFTGDGQWRAPTGAEGEGPRAALSQAEESRFNLKVETADAGKLLERLGYPNAMRRGGAKLEGNLAWNGPPTRLHFPSLSGALRIEARDGQFHKLEPGVGRLLGILSLQALPRRITLDFRDIFSEGFAFDRVVGEVSVARGVMSARDLQIDGPSAKIVMSGEVDLAAETQNLRVRVQPAVGESVAVGAMIVNPVVGAATYLAQKILRDPLGRIFAYDYAITGPWSDPKVAKLQAAATPSEERTP
ncbi:MAG: TIGR02099 family protein [Betaproteobacteria bacterium]|nr:TIGR02099 family protein [Betaproteobacteria bacterium]